jgi:hypothetical protein
LKNKIIVHAYKNTLLPTQRTAGASIREINPSVTGVCYDHSEHTNKMRGKKFRVLKVKPFAEYSNNWALKSLTL